MKRQIKRNEFPFFFCVLFLMVFLWGCGKNPETSLAANLKPIGSPPVAMKHITQDDSYGSLTFRLKIPEGWMCLSNTIGGVSIISEENYKNLLAEAKQNEKNGNTSKDDDSFEHQWEKAAAAKLDKLYLSVVCTWLGKTEEVQKEVDLLFQGNTEAFEENRIEFLIQYQKIQNAIEDMEPGSYWNPSEIKDSIPEVTPEEKASFSKPDYEYTYYNGSNGKIAEVTGAYTWNDTAYTIVEYYRENSPCVVFGAFKDSEELASGDIALWVADSLETEEHLPE